MVEKKDFLPAANTNEAEYRMMGATHAELGACLLGLWGLPESIVQAVADHHRLPQETIDFSVGTAIQMAEVLAEELEAEMDLPPEGKLLSSLLAGLQRNLRNPFPGLTIINGGAEGLELLKNQGPFAVVVSDFRMPGMDGIQFLVAAKELSPNTVRIMLTGQAGLEDAVAAMNEGNLFRFLLKPCHPEELVKILTAALEQYRLVVAEKELLEQTLHGCIKVLSDILALMSPDAFGRAVRIRYLVERIASRLQLPNRWEVEITAMLSQIGCVTIPTEILHKKITGQSLSPSETAIFLEHPITGRNLLQNIPRLEGVAEAIGYQEKQYDGGGVPKDDYKGENIPILSRSIKAASDFDLIRQATGKTECQVIKQMQKHWRWYDPNVLNALEADLNLFEENYPVQEIKTDEIIMGVTVGGRHFR